MTVIQKNWTFELHSSFSRCTIQETNNIKHTLKMHRLRGPITGWKFPAFIEPEGYYHGYKRLPFDPVMRCLNLVSTFTPPWRPILILSSHLHQDLQAISTLQVFWPKCCMQFLIVPCILHVLSNAGKQQHSISIVLNSFQGTKRKNLNFGKTSMWNEINKCCPYCPYCLFWPRASTMVTHKWSWQSHRHRWT